MYESTGLDEKRPLKKTSSNNSPARDLNPEPPEFKSVTSLTAPAVGELGAFRRTTEV
jgi:hypothetical protein